jgi:hypothetical protein
MATLTEKAREIDSGRTASVPEPIADTPVGDDGLLDNKRDPEPWRPGDTQQSPHVTTSTETEEEADTNKSGDPGRATGEI